MVIIYRIVSTSEAENLELFFWAHKKFKFDFLRNDFLPSIHISSQNNQEFRGRNFGITKIMDTKILNTNISKALFFQETK